MKTLIIILSLLTSMGFNTPPLLVPNKSNPSIGCLEMDLIIICDFSGSVYGNEKYVSEAVESFILSNNIDYNFQLGIIAFNNTPNLIAPLTPDKGKLIKAVFKMGTIIANSDTHLTPALQLALSQFTSLGVLTHRKMVILITDGKLDDESSSLQTITQLREALGISFCGIMIDNYSSDPSFFTKACKGCYVESRYDELIEQIKKLDVCL